MKMIGNYKNLEITGNENSTCQMQQGTTKAYITIFTLLYPETHLQKTGKINNKQAHSKTKVVRGLMHSS